MKDFVNQATVNWNTPDFRSYFRWRYYYRLEGFVSCVLQYRLLLVSCDRLSSCWLKVVQKLTFETSFFKQLELEVDSEDF